MKTRYTFSAIVFVALLVVAANWAQAADEKGVAITFVNQSQWAIDQLYFAPSKSEDWGPDQLGEKIIKTGESFELRSIPIGKYWIKIVDEDGDECEIPDIKVAASEKVVIDDENLVGCQAASEADEEEEEEEGEEE